MNNSKYFELASSMTPFEVKIFIEYPYIGYTLGFFSNHGLAILTLIFFFSLYFFVVKKDERKARSTRAISNAISRVYTAIYKEFNTIVTGQSGLTGAFLLPTILAIFLFIGVSNLISYIPFHFATNSHFVIPLTLAFVFNFFLVIFGPINNGFNFFKNFIPQNVPMILIPLITIIEIFSYMIRTLSLTLRLCANILAGHILLLIIGTIIINIYASHHDFLQAISIGILLFICALELMVCVVQAYVFAVLLAVYSSDSIKANH